VSEILESNGSSSMASGCAGSLALMDAGVNIKSNVSGIAMGLITEDDKYAVLSDILGDEDHLGDMDFKVTGTSEGITACQMDIKIKGLKYEILIEALNQAKKGRLEILDKLNENISIPNSTVKTHAPKIVNIEISKDVIGLVIGPGGKHIQELQKASETTIVINERDDVGVVEILGVNQEKIDYAIEKIKNLVFEPVIDEVYLVKVIKILDFGAVVEFVPGKEALLHVSEIAWERVNNVTDYINIGDEFEVKYLGIDPRTKKSKISRKVLLEKNK
jgi:polyribonucleotide nucleotidyltransferase